MKTSLISLLLLAAIAPAASAFRTDTIDVATSHLPQANRVTVITPDSDNDDSRFPTVYLLNGFGGDYTSWTKTQPRLGELADLYGMVMVMPSGLDSWYWNSPVDPSMQMESFFIEDLVPTIDDRYPTIPDAAARAITGLSMGGHGALWLAANYPDVFGSAGSTSGGVDIRPFPKSWKMASWLGPEEGNEDIWTSHTIAGIVPMLKDANINIIFDCGADDFFNKVNEQLHYSLLQAGVPHDYISRPGNHSQRYWANSILYQLLFFNEAFAQ